MKVKDLIEKLQQTDQETEVIVDCDDGYMPKAVAGVVEMGNAAAIIEVEC